MKFDDTYIILAGLRIFEPMVILTNLVFLLLAIFFAYRLMRSSVSYVRYMAWFILNLGISMAFGAAGHGVQLQAGTLVFTIILFFMNFFSLLSAFCCFMACYWLFKAEAVDRRIVAFLVIWLLLMLGAGVKTGDFLFVKIQAGVFLLFALFAHYRHWKLTGVRGSRQVIMGILISFLSIIAHSLHLSLHAWFNHKDLAHVIMIISLVVIYTGVKKNSVEMSGSAAH